jgi:glycosyltransferase involved in cell wall biosynthesis
MPKDILHILPSLNILGGTPMKTKWLIDYSSFGASVFCLEPESSYYSRQFAGQFNCPLYFGSGNVVKNLIALIRIVRQNRIKIIHSYFFSGQFYAVLLKMLFPNLKLINTFEGVPLHVSSKKRKVFNLIYSHFHYFIFISNYVKAEIEGMYPSIGNVNRSVIYNGAVERNQTNSELIEGKFILCVSGLNEYKNLDVIVDAMNFLQPNEHDIKLLIIGDGPLKEHLQQKVDNYGLNSKVLLLGYKENVGDYYSKCLFYVHPADKEGFGLAVIEAMLSRKAVVLSYSGGLKELIKDGEDGLFAKPYDAKEWAEKMRYLIENRDVAEKLANNAYDTATRSFNIDNFVMQHDTVYHNFIEKQ